MTHNRQEACRKFMYHASVPGIHAATYVLKGTRRCRNKLCCIRCEDIIINKCFCVNAFSGVAGKA